MIGGLSVKDSAASEFGPATTSVLENHLATTSECGTSFYFVSLFHYNLEHHDVQYYVSSRLFGAKTPPRINFS